MKEEKEGKSNGAGEEAGGEGEAETEAEAKVEAAEEPIDLSTIDEGKVVKIQAAARGKADRKKVAEMKADATKSGDSDEPEAAAAAEGDAPEEPIDLSTVDESKVVKIQAAARGKADRKKVAEMKAGAATSVDAGAEESEAAKEAKDTSADAPVEAGEAEGAAAE